MLSDRMMEMLGIQLQALEHDGLISRQVHGAKRPLKVGDTLTEFGKTLVPALEAIAKWGRELGDNQGERVGLH